MTMTVTNIDTRGLNIRDGHFGEDTITLAGADTLPAGTILARDSVSLKLVLFVKGGATNENGIPKAVLAHEVVATGAGDLPVRALLGGKMGKDKLIIDADGDDSNIDQAVRDQLRDFGLEVDDITELMKQDNQ